MRTIDHPLRRILLRQVVENTYIEVLDCGHVVELPWPHTPAFYAAKHGRHCVKPHQAR